VIENKLSLRKWSVGSVHFRTVEGTLETVKVITPLQTIILFSTLSHKFYDEVALSERFIRICVIV